MISNILPITVETKWDGEIEEVAIFHRPLTRAEIKELNEAGYSDNPRWMIAVQRLGGQIETFAHPLT